MANDPNVILRNLGDTQGFNIVGSSLGDAPLSTQGHFFNGALANVNLCFADGHVASNPRSKIKVQYFAGYWWYY